MIYNNALIYVNGDWENVHDQTILTNKGDIELRADLNEADFSILDSAQVEGSGNYRLENDWTNSGVFIADSSSVYLDGDNEAIQGDSISRFFDLTLEGTGVKTQWIDAEVKHQLNLNDLELATQDNEMWVSNSWVDAIVHQSSYLSEGLVSSGAGGLLIRNTDSVFTYLFPVGSKVNGHQYRPVTLENLVLNNEKTGVRMIPVDASLDGYDRNLTDSLICLINPDYYHQITNIDQLDQSNISIFYDVNTEPSWNILAHWNAPSSSLWNSLTSSSSSTGNYAALSLSNYNDFSEDFYAFGYRNNSTPIIYGDTIICDTVPSYQYATGNFSDYIWESYHNGQLTATSTNSEFDASWFNSGTNQVVLYVTDALGCTSPSASLDIWVNHISAGYDTTSGIGLGNINFVNTSIGADSYLWNIADDESTDTDVSHTFSNVGEYSIQLIAYNQLGCSDTLNSSFIVPSLFWIPNVFTPNANEGNNEFYIDAIGVKEYRMKIYDRWGLLLFESTNERWDGTNQFNGKDVPEGTYFYVYEAVDIFDQSHLYNGPLSLFR